MTAEPLPEETANRIATSIAAVLTHPEGAFGVLRDAEEALGATIVPVGANVPFALPRADWTKRTLVTLWRGDVRLVAIEAVRPHTGAFRRLVDAIQAAKLTPVIVAPVGPVMPGLMRRWGWTRGRAGRGFTAREEWRPPL